MDPGDDFFTCPTAPDTYSGPFLGVLKRSIRLHVYLACCETSLFLTCLHRATITRTVFTGDADFLGTFRLVNGPSIPLHSTSNGELTV